ncbi:MAG: Mrp/NBP35 family ATP-binding protein [Coriobacteriales bacterium]|nr:Mrp/NBP35 family ATP-binding protein [Coriobacteriales bacterium]
MTPEEEEAIRHEFEQSRKQGHDQQPQHQGPELFQTNVHSSVKHVIGIVSGKGGVGKSLVTGILATELMRAGYKVGILDADITGPSIPKMFGLSDDRMTAISDHLLIPGVTQSGIKVASTNLILEHETDPVIWRGPLLGGVIKQFFEDVYWGEIDYLLVDMPPGTGDVALTVFQSLPIEGVVIVSSPQDLVQIIVGKAVNMAAMMDVPVIGLVENMSYFVCPDCGKRHEIFGPSRAKETAEAFGIDLLDQLPIDPAIAALCDRGILEQGLPEHLLDGTLAVIAEHDKN